MDQVVFGFYFKASQFINAGIHMFQFSREMNRFLNFIILLVFACQSPFVYSQQGKQIEILHANTAEYSKQIPDANRLIGEVQFKHENAIMSCDSAYFYSKENYIDAFGHIHINQGDTLHLYGKTLKYDGKTRIAQIRDNVKLMDSQNVLTTNYLDFKIAEDIGYYTNGGNIVNGENKLSSNVGYYYAKPKLFYYRTKVVIINPQYIITSDTIKYNTISKTAFFYGPTDITSKENYIYCENGWYNTAANISQFNKNAYLKSATQLLKGDSLYYERTNGIGRAFHNIWLIDSTQKVIISGNYANYREKPQYAMITDSAVFMQYNDKDTMFVHADTLLSIADSANMEKTIRAYHHVKIYKIDMQGKCDSLTYTSVDSTMRMFFHPVLLTDENQLSSDYIEMLMANQKINRINLNTSSFIISKEDSGKFSQIKGKKMTGFFKENELYKVNVSGNGQAVYYVKDKDVIVGVNKSVCSDLIIFIEKRKIQRIVFLTQPDATLYPLDRMPKEETILKDFKWYEKSRPATKEEIFNWDNE
jgi:lipopolysaccharide export system protein LptA